jgi:hypothetical protein
MTDPRIVAQMHLAEAYARAQTRAIAAQLEDQSEAWNTQKLIVKIEDLRSEPDDHKDYENNYEAGWQDACNRILMIFQSAPATDQAEGPSLDDVAELCEEFEFHLEGDGLEILQEMITAAITRWRAPAAQPAKPWPVNLAELHDPDFSDGLTPSQHLDVLRGGPDPRATATASPGLPPRVGHVLRLAEIIREVDGKHDLGAAALAEAILAHPGFGGCHDGPAASAVSPAEPSPVAISEAQNIGDDELFAKNSGRCPIHN